jgi:hypothetical protein
VTNSRFVAASPHNIMSAALPSKFYIAPTVTPSATVKPSQIVGIFVGTL